MSTLTFRYRIKDATTAQHLISMSQAANRVWNYCQDVSLLALRRDKRWLSAYELHKLTAGISKDLRLSADTIQQVCTEYITRRRQCKAPRLKWRSKKWSLGWIPFKAAYVRLDGDTLTYCGRRFRLWLSRPVDGTIKTGSFSQDARGRWYANLQCDVGDHTAPLGRNDWTHKVTTAIARRAHLIVVGDVSSTQLAQTPFAKATYDAAWGTARHQLHYKAIRLAGVCVPGRKVFSTVTCSACLQRTGPSGLSNLLLRRVDL